MKKIIIVGSGGVGKSTFARRLSEKTGIEVIHLDQLYWKPNWVETPKDEWQQIVKEIIKGDGWILDGNFGGTMEMRIEACDTVIFLEMPRIVCVYRILKRVAKYRNKTRPDMANDCNEKFDIKFFGWIWNFEQTTKPRIEKLLNKFQNEKTIVRLKSKREVEKFFVNLTLKNVESKIIAL